MTLKTFSDPNGNYMTRKTLPPSRITINSDEFHESILYPIWDNATFTRTNQGFWNFSVNNINEGGNPDSSYTAATYLLIGSPTPNQAAKTDNIMVRLYLHPEPTVNLNHEDSGNGTVVVTDLIPIQVIQNVDLVKGKRTLVRTVLTYLNGTTNTTQTATVTNIYLNHTPQGFSNHSNPINLAAGANNNLDVFFQPNIEGTSILITAEISSTVPGFNKTNITRVVNVVRTREFNITFVSVDTPKDFENTALDNIEFLNKTYPVSDNGIIYQLNRTDIKSFSWERNIAGVYLLMHRVKVSTLIAGKLPERAVGILPYNWFHDYMGMPSDFRGMAKPSSPVVLIEEDFGNPFQILNHNAAHELGHTYGLCDEYDNDTWRFQNGFILGLCPNGDINNDEFVDSICLSYGCPTSTLQPLSKRTDNATLYNFMGGTGHTEDAWITNESFNHLLSQFKHSSPQFAQSRIVVTGKINKTANTSKFDNFYTIGAGLVINQSEYTTGNYSIEVFDNSSNLSYIIRFDVSFLNIFFGGNTTETNETSFAFTIPFYANTSKFVLKELDIIKDTRNITNNKPFVRLISSVGNQVFSNQIINITWNGSDSDGDNVSYAILFSPDNGTTYNTLIFDLNETSYIINSSDLADSNKYLLKILATDGINTNETIINSTFEVNNDLNITEFNIVYANQTQRVFRITVNNTLSSNITNISWSFNSGQDIKSSTILFNLKPSEEIFIYIYNNYSTTGNFTTIFKAQSGNFIETENREIVI